MQRNFQVILDFLVNLKADKTQVERLAKEVENIIRQINPNINFNSNEVRNGIKQLIDFLRQAEDGAEDLEKILSSLDINLNTDEAKKALEGIRSALDEIERTDLSKIERAFKDVEGSNIEESVLELDKALQDLDTSKFDAEVEKLADSFLKARQETERLIGKQKLALQALKASGKEGSEAYDRLEKEIKEAEQQLEKFSKTTKETASIGDKFAKFGMITMGIQQITSTLSRFQEPFVELDRQVRNIGTLGVKNFQEFASAATELSKKIPYSAGEIAQGIYDAISAGTIKVKDGMADVAEGMKFIETASKLATAGLTSTQDAINGLTSVMNAYGIEASRASEVADVFFGAVNVGKTTIPELNASLSQVIPTAAAFGVEFDQVAAAIATMTKQGTPTAQAATQIRAALTELAKPGAALAPILQKAGVSLESLRKEGLQESLRKIGIALEDAGKSATQVFSSVEAASAVMLLSGKNAQMAADDFNAVANAIGSTDAAFAVASEGIGNKTKTMMNTIQAGFNSLMGALGTVGQTVLATATQISPLVTSFVGLSNLIPKGSINKVGELAKNLLGKLVPALAGATAGQKALNAAMLVNPYALAIAGVTALAAGLYFLVKALHKTTEEKLEDAKKEIKAEEELLESKIKINRQQRELAQSNLNLVKAFQEQGAAAMQNEALLSKLARAYPGVIDQSKSYAENLKALEEAAKKDVEALEKLNKEMVNLANQSIELKIKTAELKVDVAKEKLKEQLGAIFYRGNVNIIMDNYVKAIYEAKDDASLQKASMDFQRAILDENNKMFNELNATQKQKILEAIEEMTVVKKKAIEEQNRSIEKDLEYYKKKEYKEEEIVKTLAKKYKKAEKEIEEMIKKQEESKAETEKQVSAVDKLAEAWSNAASEVDKNIKSQLGAANEILKELQNQSLTEDQRAKLKQQHKEIIKDLQRLVKEKKNLDEIDKLNQMRAGLIVKTGKSAFELAKEQAEIKVKTLDLEKQNYEYLLNEQILAENRKKDAYDDFLISQKQLETIKKQRLAWIEALKAKKLITDISPEGEIIFSSKVTPVERQEIESILQDYNKKIQDAKGKLQELKLKIRADDVELQNKMKELEQRKFEWEISIGIRDETALDALAAEYKDRLSVIRNEIESNNAQILKLNQEMENELSRVSGENAEQERERIRIRYSLRLKELKEHGLELQQEEFETLQKIEDTEEKSYRSRLDRIKKFEEERLQEIEERYSKEEELLNRFIENYNKAVQKRMDFESTDVAKKIEDEEKARIAELEKWRNMEAISAEEFENRKAKIEEEGRKRREKQEEEYRKKQLRMEAQRQGLEIELQRRKDVEILNVQRNSLNEQLKLLKEKATRFDELGRPIFDSKKDKEEYDALAKKLDETEKLISQKADSLVLMVTGLQTTVTDSLTNLFAGDPEAAADSWRKFFAQLAGMLQAKASAFVLDLVLSPGTMQYLSTLPFPANALAIPVITAIISAAVKAITDPIISAILSFSTGGRVDQPVMALVGDASRLGGRNREWIFRDDQLIAIVQMATIGANAMLVAKLDRLEKLLASQELRTTLRGSDIDIALKRTTMHKLARYK